MSKNKKVMSIAISPELHDDLKKYAKRKGQTLSTYLGHIMSKVVKLNIDDDVVVFGKPIDEDVLPVVLKIPANLRSNAVALKSWMDVQVNGIVARIANSESKHENSGD